MNKLVMLEKAINQIRPNSHWTLSGPDIIWKSIPSDNNTFITVSENLIWLDINTQEKPSKEEIDDALEIVEAEYNTNEYQRQRQPEYPPLADLADALYWQAQGDESKMTAYLAAVDAVKTKYPKGGA